MDLSKKTKFLKSTLDEWKYNPQRYIPLKVVPKEIIGALKILDKKEDNWGSIKGGKNF